MTPFNEPGHFLEKTGVNNYAENIWVNLQSQLEVGKVTQSSFKNTDGTLTYLFTLQIIMNGQGNPFSHTWNERFQLTLDPSYSMVRIDVYDINGTLVKTAIDRLEDAYSN